MAPTSPQGIESDCGLWFCPTYFILFNEEELFQLPLEFVSACPLPPAGLLGLGVHAACGEELFLPANESNERFLLRPAAYRES